MIGIAAPSAQADKPVQWASAEKIQLALVPVKKVDGNTVKSKRVYLGHAPYICGPSGFGRTSACFLRASLK